MIGCFICNFWEYKLSSGKCSNGTSLFGVGIDIVVDLGYFWTV
nr:MAG TPA: hypothetical protein [Caudoviricetes sp.]